jgi:hypothetical protein
MNPALDMLHHNAVYRVNMYFHVIHYYKNDTYIIVVVVLSYYNSSSKSLQFLVIIAIDNVRHLMSAPPPDMWRPSPGHVAPPDMCRPRTFGAPSPGHVAPPY